MATIAAYLEIGSKRTFAGAIEWPGWCRGGRTEDEAVATLVAYGPRYAKIAGKGASAFGTPKDVSSIEIVERVAGSAATDFGAPNAPPSRDSLPLNGAELDRLVSLLRASWAAFDAAAQAATGHELRKGPRGGGRDMKKMIEHVLGGEQAYLRELGGAYKGEPGASVQAELAAVREAAIQKLRARADGEEPTWSPRRKRPFWSPRFFVRYTSWHALDHAWEIEDRVIP